MAEQLRRVAPAIILELPALTRREDGHYAAPVLRLELFRSFNQDKSHGPVRVDILHQSVYL